MKSIEERAKDYAPDAFDADLIVPAKEGYIVKVQRGAYIQGATEQKAIDDAERDTAVYNLLQLKLDNEKKLWLDKACDAYCHRCPNYADDAIGLQGCSGGRCDVLRDFRKELEGTK